MKKKKRNLDVDHNKTFLGIKFITESSEILDLTIKTRFLAILLYHKYISKYEFMAIITASLNISSKLHEEDKTLKQIIIATTYVKSLYEGSTTINVPNISYTSYVNLKEKAIETELEILLDNNFNIVYDDLYQVFFDQYNTLDNFEAEFYKLNTILFNPHISLYTSEDLLDSKNMSKLYEETKQMYEDNKSYKINTETFESKRKDIYIDKTLLTKFIGNK